MTRKERIVKAMNRDAEIHARGYFTSEERDTNANATIFSTARWMTIEIDREEDQVVARMMELVEAK